MISTLKNVIDLKNYWKPKQRFALKIGLFIFFSLFCAIFHEYYVAYVLITCSDLIPCLNLKDIYNAGDLFVKNICYR